LSAATSVRRSGAVDDIFAEVNEALRIVAVNKIGIVCGFGKHLAPRNAIRRSHCTCERDNSRRQSGIPFLIAVYTFAEDHLHWPVLVMPPI